MNVNSSIAMSNTEQGTKFTDVNNRRTGLRNSPNLGGYFGLTRVILD